MSRVHFLTGAICVLFLALLDPQILAADEISVLFLGDQGHHQPRKLAEAITPVLEKSGIHVTYTEDLQQLGSENLKKYSGLLLYANIDVLPAEVGEAPLRFSPDGQAPVRANRNRPGAKKFAKENERRRK